MNKYALLLCINSISNKNPCILLLYTVKAARYFLVSVQNYSNNRVESNMAIQEIAHVVFLDTVSCTWLESNKSITGT